MKHRLCSLLLALVASGTVCLSAAAYSFPEPYVYDEQFTDVNAEDWFYENVKALYQLGLTNGQGCPDVFAPADAMTLAEAVTIGARLRSLHDHNDPEAGAAAYAVEGDAWYTRYVAYLQSVAVIGAEFDGLYDHSADRSQVAHILSHALPEELLTPINAEAVAIGYASREYIQDVNDYTPYREDILKLYRWGILSGTDDAGSFHPDDSIQRSEVAAMVTRLAYPELRITLQWTHDLDSSKSGSTMEDLVASDGTFHPSPSITDEQAIDDNIRYMLSRGERKMTLSYGPGSVDEARVNNIVTAFLNGTRFYVEQGYNQVQASFSPISGTVVLMFSSSLWTDRMIDSYRETTMEAAIQVHDQLWEQGVITSSMTEFDKARAYYTWLCEHCQYDYAAVDTSLSHSGYGALCQQLAVCDGYTSAYNLLLKLEGITCTTMSTPDHIWTVATLDGTDYHIDPTWGDQTGEITYRYFAMTEQDSMARFA